MIPTWYYRGQRFSNNNCSPLCVQSFHLFLSAELSPINRGYDSSLLTLLFVCFQKLQSKCRRPTKGGLLADSSLTFGDVCEGCSWPAYSCVSPPPFPGTNPDLTSSSSFLTGRASYVSLMPGCQIMTQTGRIRKMSSCTFLERRIRVQVFAGGFLLLLLLSPNPSFLSHQLDFPSADQSI